MVDLLQEIKQKQILSFQQTQSLKILAMSNLELYDLLQREQTENPVLEVEGASGAEEYRSIGDWFSRKKRLTESPGWDGDDDGLEDEIGQAQSDTLADTLKAQIRLHCYTERETALIHYIIDLLDEDGYLLVSTEEIGRLTDSSPEQIQKCLDAIRCMEPAGVGAGSLCECLLLQLRAKGITDPNLERIIRGCLPEVASGHYHKIAGQLSISTEAVRECVRVIRSLNPRPGSGFGSQSGPDFVIPDVIFDRQGDTWEITLNDKWMGSIGISRMYEALSRSAQEESTAEYLKEKIRRAQFLMKSIEQRRNTLLRVASVILNRQKDYLEQKGPLAPLSLGTVAKELQIHESTVSRTIREKYVQTPLGTHPFRQYFSAGLMTCGGPQSSSAVKDKIAGLVREENSSRPLSDSALAEELKKQGVEISRRTVAKYREELQIRNAAERRAD